jgi:hypothetical protein
MTPQQKQQVAAAVTIGGDRETAAHYAGLTPEIVAAEMLSDETFGREIRRAEATAEINHLRTIHNAVQDPKNWRAAVWYLKSRSPERYDRKQHTINDDELAEFVAKLMEALHELVPEESREELARRVDRLVSAVA